MKTILVTGGCGFIGSNFIRLLCAKTDWCVINLDKLTYAGNLENVADLPKDRVRFVQGDICNQDLVGRIITEEKLWAVVNFAAESHVDRSILDSNPFLRTNVGGVLALLQAIRAHPVERLLHVSTDEVYGDNEGKSPSTEESALLPSSPYAATKAAADLLCFSYRRTYGVPVIVTRSTNNYGPYQFPEKLIPLLIQNGLNGLDLPVYGDGKQIREWLYVEDNCRAILDVLKKGQVGSIYNVSTGEERANLDVVYSICEAIAKRCGTDVRQIRERIRSVTDRPGHDRRYAIDSSKIRNETGWRPQVNFEDGIKQTVDWYLSHLDWAERVTSGAYHNYYEAVYQRAWGKGQSA